MMMVDNIPVAVMWCNASDAFTITYSNSAAQSLLGQLKDAIGFTPDALRGKSIDFLFSDSHTSVPDLKNSQKLPYHGRLKIGHEHVDLRITAVVDHGGVYCGAMVTMNMITQQVVLANDFDVRIKAVAGELSSSATDMEINAKGMASTTDAANDQASAVAAASEMASVGIQTVAAAAEELSGSIGEISRQVHSSNLTAQEAVQEAERTNALVEVLPQRLKKSAKWCPSSAISPPRPICWH